MPLWGGGETPKEKVENSGAGHRGTVAPCQNPFVRIVFAKNVRIRRDH